MKKHFSETSNKVCCHAYVHETDMYDDSDSFDFELEYVGGSRCSIKTRYHEKRQFLQGNCPCWPEEKLDSCCRMTHKRYSITVQEFATTLAHDSHLYSKVKYNCDPKTYRRYIPKGGYEDLTYIYDKIKRDLMDVFDVGDDADDEM